MKWEIIKRLEEEKKKRDTRFQGFYVEEKDPIKRMNVIIDNFEILYVELEKKPEGQSSKPSKLPIKPSGIVIIEPLPDTSTIQL